MPWGRWKIFDQMNKVKKNMDFKAVNGKMPKEKVKNIIKNYNCKRGNI